MQQKPLEFENWFSWIKPLKGMTSFVWMWLMRLVHLVDVLRHEYWHTRFWSVCVCVLVCKRRKGKDTYFNFPLFLTFTPFSYSCKSKGEMAEVILFNDDCFLLFGVIHIGSARSPWKGQVTNDKYNWKCWSKSGHLSREYGPSQLWKIQ